MYTSVWWYLRVLPGGSVLESIPKCLHNRHAHTEYLKMIEVYGTFGIWHVFLYSILKHQYLPLPVYEVPAKRLNTTKSTYTFTSVMLARTLNSRGNKFANVSENYVLTNISKCTVIQNALINVFTRIKLTSNTGGCFVCSWWPRFWHLATSGRPRSGVKINIPVLKIQVQKITHLNCEHNIGIQGSYRQVWVKFQF